ncbi:Ger(x)C family spore germination protein [Cytobacillus praedii]|uniref:Ger(x)C family spore germination protein n=1 Tax=Cytobacillus praedii TaxID=1742358 RepID=UPI002E24D585|nr:Ger(x)C family spore germination protein [Cytobacillus praedii]
MIYRYFCIVVTVLLLSSCVEKSIIDDINIQSAVAIDLADDDKLKGMILVQNYLPDQAVENIRFTSTGKIRRDLLLNIQKKSSQQIVVGGLMVSIFGDQISKKGIAEAIDAYQRDPGIGSRNYLATSSGSALKILEGEYGPRGNGTYLRNLLEHNIQYRDVPETNLHIFLRDYNSEWKDAFLPELRSINNEEVEISGISLFKRDKEIDVIPKDKMFYFKLLVDRHSNGNFLVELGENKTAMVKSIKSKRKIKMSRKNHSQMILNIHINGVVTEYTGKKMSKEIADVVEKELEKKVNAESLKLIKQFQEKGVDPIGFGLVYRSKHRGAIKKIKNWGENDYKNLSFKINTKVDISESGVIE